jgi:hypothetical protein
MGAINHSVCDDFALVLSKEKKAVLRSFGVMTVGFYF